MDRVKSIFETERSYMHNNIGYVNKYIRTCVWELSMNNRAENKKAMSSDCDKESERTVVILYGYVKEFNKFEGNARFKKEERILQAAFKWREEEFRMRLHKR